MNSLLLTQADELMSRPETGPEGVWPRAAALLARQALEDALDLLWQQDLPGLQYASTRTQLLCLAFLTPDKSIADDVKSAWTTLSRACHHHQYELAPTADELRYWIDQVNHLVGAIRPTGR